MKISCGAVLLISLREICRGNIFVRILGGSLGKFLGKFVG